MATSPSIIASVKDINSITVALTGDEYTLIRYRSNAYATMSATAYGGASIDNDSYIIINSGERAYSNSTTFNGVEDDTFYFSVCDSNGNYGSLEKVVNMIPYVELTCNMSDNRPDASGNMLVECSGDCFNGSFGASSNSLTVRYRYRVRGGSYGSWQSMTVSKNGNTYTADAELSGLDYQTNYIFEAQATDELTTVTSSETGVFTRPVFHWGRDDFRFEVPVEFASNVKMEGNMHLNYRNRLYFDEADALYIGQENANELTLSAYKIKINADGAFYVNNKEYLPPLHGMWTPALSSGAVSSYTLRSGWYSRVGEVVTVGFYIKANCNSGYEGNTIVISGLPYVPYSSASGGGICSGAYVAGGYTFQCFVAEEDANNITVRVQECDRQNDANISTSASGCRYPKDGGTITLSGTITYCTIASYEQV